MTEAGLDAAPGVAELAIVQHAHQLIVTDGYADREGIGELLDAYTAILELHLEYGVPLNLHLSGTLLEAAAWHRPSFLDRVTTLRQAGLLELIGSAYAQCILTVCTPEHGVRQLNEGLEAYRRLLGVDPSEVRTLWVPERVWATERIAMLLRSEALVNGGYDHILLDDRLAYSPTPAAGSTARSEFDRRTVPAHGVLSAEAEARAADGGAPLDHLRPFRVEGVDGVIAVPIRGDLRYAVPPRDARAWRVLRRVLDEAIHAGPECLVVFGDDLERSASVGPWTDQRWTADAVGPYAEMLRWLRDGGARPVLLTDRLRLGAPAAPRRVEPGTYYELAHTMGAGERYTGWHDDPRWRPYARLLEQAEALVARTDWASDALRELAWKQLMACSNETAWQEPDGAGARHPAPWTRAAATHARAVFVIRAAAERLAQRDGSVTAEAFDIDDDGYDEVVLANDRVLAVLTPRWGGRLVYLFDLEHGKLAIGNPADDWNRQEEMNRFMEVPRNHPGAFVDVGHENDRHTVRRLASVAWPGAEAWLVNTERGSSLEGTVKRFRLRAGARALDAKYILPPPVPRGESGLSIEVGLSVESGLHVEFGLSPDYLALLRTGRHGLRRVRSRARRGVAKGACTVWVEPAPDAPLAWAEPVQPEFGHGLNLCLAAHGRAFGVRLGVSDAQGDAHRGDANRGDAHRDEAHRGDADRGDDAWPASREGTAGPAAR